MKNHANIKASERIKEAKNLNIAADLNNRYQDLDEAEKKKVDKLKEKLRIFAKNKDYAGAQKYLNHLKKTVK